MASDELEPDVPPLEGDATFVLDTVVVVVVVDETASILADASARALPADAVINAAPERVEAGVVVAAAAGLARGATCVTPDERVASTALAAVGEYVTSKLAASELPPRAPATEIGTNNMDAHRPNA